MKRQFGYLVIVTWILFEICDLRFDNFSTCPLSSTPDTRHLPALSLMKSLSLSMGRWVEGNP